MSFLNAGHPGFVYERTIYAGKERQKMQPSCVTRQSRCFYNHSGHDLQDGSLNPKVGLCKIDADDGRVSTCLSI